MGELAVNGDLKGSPVRRIQQTSTLSDHGLCRNKPGHLHSPQLNTILPPVLPLADCYPSLQHNWILLSNYSDRPRRDAEVMTCTGPGLRLRLRLIAHAGR